MEDKKRIKLSKLDEEQWQEEKTWHLHRASENYLRQKFKNERDYERRGGGRSASRITIPCLEKRNLDDAIKHLSSLVEDLKNVRSANLPFMQKMGAMRTAIYLCHTNLKRDGDMPTLMPKYPTNDYRGAK